MDVCCECCVFSGRGLCDELITYPEESHQLWCVVVCDLETSRMRRPWPALGRNATAKKIIIKVSRSSRKVPANLPEFNETLTGSTDFRKIFRYKISWKSLRREPRCSLRTDKYDETNSRFSQFWERTWRPVQLEGRMFYHKPYAFRSEGVVLCMYN